MKMIYTNEISEQIVGIISTIESLKTVSKGDLSMVPSPELFKKFMPACIVKPLTVKNEWANVTQKILSSEYHYKIFYLKSYNMHDETELLNLNELCINESQPICELLLDNLTLNDFKTENGFVTSSICNEMSFSNGYFEFFKEMNVPAAIVEMDYVVYFKTYSNLRR